MDKNKRPNLKRWRKPREIIGGKSNILKMLEENDPNIIAEE